MGPSTTGNVVQHHAGALNIDACRLSYSSENDKTPVVGKGSFQPEPGIGAEFPHHKEGWGAWQVNHQGRWPANILLRHRSGCRAVGTNTVPGYTINRWSDGAKPFGGGAGHPYESQVQPEETFVLWDCAPDCPVLVMDEQSGTSVSSGGRIANISKGQRIYGGGRGLGVDLPPEAVRGDPGYGDIGGASRYFKQVQENDMAKIPEELWDYLKTLIAPPAECEPVLIIESDLDAIDFTQFDDQSVHGMITMGNPEKYLAEIDRVLRPGAHLLLISSEEEPTGHSGACAVEEFGYEIRDAIAVLDTPGEFHYVAKAASAERNAGIELKENATGRLVQNDHPTVKAIGVMEALLADVPQDAVVCDPFMGSGTTGIACRRTGHSFIGIEQDAEYLKIADQRIHYWDRAFAAWNGADIESEAALDEDESPMSVADLFGFANEEDGELVGGCPVCEERDEEIEIKEKGKRMEVCSECAKDRDRVRAFLEVHPEWD